MAKTTLSVTTSAGTKTFSVGRDNRMIIHSNTAATARLWGQRAGEGFAEIDPAPKPVDTYDALLPPSYVSALSYAGGDITVTEAGGYKPDWTKSRTVTVDDNCVLQIDGPGGGKVPLAGISAISVSLPTL